MVLFLNTKFPRTEKKYAKQADDNTDLLIDRMSKLLKQEEVNPALAAIAAIKTKSGGSTKLAYSYAERKKAKTFRLT